MYKLCLSFCCLFLVLHANAQERKWQYRIGFDAFVTDLVNIEEVPSATIQVKNYGAVIPHVQAGRKLNEKWVLETGIGFIRHKSAFRSEEFPLVNSLEYLAVPVGVQYKLMHWGHTSWNLGGAIWNKFLVYDNSNLPDIVRDLIYVYPNFNTYVMNVRLTTGVEWVLKNKQALSLSGFVSRDITAYLNKRGPLDHLQTSRYLFGGLGLSYTF